MIVLFVLLLVQKYETVFFLLQVSITNNNHH